MDLALVSHTFETLRLTPPSKLTLLEAQTLSSAHVPPFPPDMPAVLTGIDSRELALQVKEVLLAVYPEEHAVIVVDQGKRIEEGLGEFGVEDFSEQTCLYLPALEDGSSFESFAEIIAHLRAPDGCPWDKVQTHKSLRTHLLEESYETLSAIDAGDFESMREEFGDLLLQIVLNAQIGSEEKNFTITQVIKSIYDKIIRRHPHVFGDVMLEGVSGVLQNWEKLKEQERKGKKEDKGLLDGVPAALPALTQAQEYQDRAARVGFDWPEIQGVLDKVREEIDEIEKAENLEEVTGELGDLFFALVNLARWRKVDAESALRETNLKFKKRFAYVEQGAKNRGRDLSDMSLDEMDALWDEAKQRGM
jgi:tetrapyrrole methylase family protein/MazG family protein